jgi:hypothetical protein
MKQRLMAVMLSAYALAVTAGCSTFGRKIMTTARWAARKA